MLGNACSLAFRAECAHEIEEQANDQDQAEAASTDGRTPKVKPAAAKQKQQHNDQE